MLRGVVGMSYVLGPRWLPQACAWVWFIGDVMRIHSASLAAENEKEIVKQFAAYTSLLCSIHVNNEYG